MNRTQGKYLLISTAMHGLLVIVLVVGSAFAPSRPVTDDMPIINFVPDILTDEKAFGGGEPGPPPAPGPKSQVVQSLPPASEEAKKPEPPQKSEPPVKPEPKPEIKPDPKPEPEPKKEEVKDQANPDDLAMDPPKKTVKPPKKERVLDLNPVTRNTDAKATAAKKREKEEADRRTRQEATEAWNKQLVKSIGSIKGGLSSGVSMEGVVGGKGSGTGTGGASYANWAQFVISLYDNNFVAPDNVTDSSLSTRVKIVVSRDGRIVSDTIVKRSGNAALDRAVSTTLERIRSVPRFPDGATDERRTLIINFNIHGKLSAG
jgi:TonB family protein